MPPKVVRLAERTLATAFGKWREILYTNGQSIAAALAFGTWSNSDIVPCRIQSHCLSSFVFNSIECDCREQLTGAQQYISGHGFGIVIWLDQDGRGHGHMAYMLASELSLATGISETTAYEQLGYSVDARSYAMAASVIHDLGVRTVELLSNDPNRAKALDEFHVKIARQRNIVIDPKGNDALLRSYRDKQAQGHTIDLPIKDI